MATSKKVNDIATKPKKINDKTAKPKKIVQYNKVDLQVSDTQLKKNSRCCKK